jgi:hypothetical protein
MPSSHGGSDTSSSRLINPWQPAASNTSKDPIAQAHGGFGVTPTAQNTMFSPYGGSNASSGRLVNPWQTSATSNADDVLLVG